MKTKTIKTVNHQENWKVCENLIKLGYTKIADCVWSKTFINYETNEQVIVTLAL